MNDRRINLDKRPAPCLQEIAGRLKKLSYRDAERFGSIIAENLTDAAKVIFGSGVVVQAILDACDQIEAENTKPAGPTPRESSPSGYR
jgi:hypothetical protein